MMDDKALVRFNATRHGVLSRYTVLPWEDADEYQRARWAYEGQGASATKAAWVLGAGLLGALGFAAVVGKVLFKPFKSLESARGIPQQQIQRSQQIPFAAAVVKSAKTLAFLAQLAFIAFDPLADFGWVFG